MDAAFKIAIAAEDSDGNEIMVFYSRPIASGSGPLFPMQVVQP